MVVAMTPEGIIGNDGDMPWRLSSDLRRFKRLTMGGTLIMGRKTYQSIGRPLPGRRTIVLSRQPDSIALQPGLAIIGTPQRALEMLEQSPEMGYPQGGFVVGGAQIYELFRKQITELWLTRVWAHLQGDTRIDWLADGGRPSDDFWLASVTRIPGGSKDDYPTDFEIWKRYRQVR